jgi:hypothetical protein
MKAPLRYNESTHKEEGVGEARGSCWSATKESTSYWHGEWQRPAGAHSAQSSQVLDITWCLEAGLRHGEYSGYTAMRSGIAYSYLTLLARHLLQVTRSLDADLSPA